MTAVGNWILRFGLVLPALLVVVLAVPRFSSGLALEAAYPVPPYIAKNVTVTRHAYLATAAILSHASPDDGETEIVRAEAAHLAGLPDAGVVPVVESGLARAPGSARGWTLLSELLEHTDRSRGAKALVTAIELARYDYFLAARRACAGVVLWDAVAVDDRPLVLRQIGLLWSEPPLRPGILHLLDTPGGPALMSRALHDDPQQIRLLNRWVARRRLGIPANQG
jgi:hypothetical protein